MVAPSAPEPGPPPPEDRSASPAAQPPGDAAAADPASSDLDDGGPLTPADLEDEAIRGDFVLRWAVVGLAFLAGCTQLRDARILVHVRSGNWLGEHGIWPPALDPFSWAASDRRWVNLSWLFDLATATWHRWTGPHGISLAQGLIAAGVLAIVVHAGRRNVRTWWSSVCGVLLILAAYPQFEWRPQVVTLLGTAGLLWALFRREERRFPPPLLWLLPIGICVWAQLDPSAWIGLLLLWLYAAGTMAQSPICAAQRPTAQPALWKVAAVSTVALAMHPFFGEPLWSPFQQYFVEFPALRSAAELAPASALGAQPLWLPAAWAHVDHRLVAAVLLQFGAFATLVLNREHACLSHWLLFVGGNLPACLATTAMPVAAVVNALIASVQAQECFLRVGGQVAATPGPGGRGARGGRAVTVVAFTAFGWLLVSGHLDGPDGHRTGTGISRGLRQQLDDLRSAGGAAFDDRGFHLTMEQGDALIAAGHQSFVDHRVGIFCQGGGDNLLTTASDVRRTIADMRESDPAEATAAWRRLVEQYGASHVLVPLTADEAKDGLLIPLLAAPPLALTDLRSTVAVFHITETDDSELAQFAAGHTVNVIREVFRSDHPVDLPPRDPVAPPAWTSEWIEPPSRIPASGTMLADHWQDIGAAVPTAPLPFKLAISIAEVRSALQGITETPDAADAYLELAEAYFQLLELEATLLPPEALQPLPLRFYQAVAAARQAGTLAPDDPRIDRLLLELWRFAGRTDVAVETIDHLLPQVAEVTESSDADTLRALRGHLAEAVERTDERMQRRLQERRDRLQTALEAYQQGCLNRPITLLLSDPVYLEQNVLARWYLCRWLAERGDVSLLQDSAEAAQRVGTPPPSELVFAPVAYSAAICGDYPEAIRVWQQNGTQLEQALLESLLTTAPAATPQQAGADAAFPTVHLLALQECQRVKPMALARLSLDRALCHLETGRAAAARDELAKALEQGGHTPLRRLLRLYWYCFDQRLIDSEPPSDWIPLSTEIFTPE